MRTTAVASQMLVRLLGLILIVLGAAFWAGHARSLIPIHMLLGVLLVLALWVLAGIGARARVGTGLVIVAFVWGLVVLGVGMGQRTMLPGTLHWTIQFLHLILGLGAMGLAEAIGGRVKRGLATAAA